MDIDIPFFDDGDDHGDPVLAHDIGLETVDGEVETLLTSGDTLPASTAEEFTNSEDQQRAVELRVRADTGLEVERIEDVVFEDIPPAPAWTLGIEVRFTVDRSGRLRIAAEEAEHGYYESYSFLLPDDYVG